MVGVCMIDAATVSRHCRAPSHPTRERALVKTRDFRNVAAPYASGCARVFTDGGGIGGSADRETCLGLFCIQFSVDVEIDVGPVINAGNMVPGAVA